jgi:hypothetical protein
VKCLLNVSSTQHFRRILLTPFTMISALLNRLTPKSRATRLGSVVAALLLSALPLSAQATPNGTWLSKPQIWFHSSNDTLNQVMARIKQERYEYVFLDYRNVDEADQQRVSQAARDYQLIPIVWIQSPQYRSLSVAEMIQEAQYADGIQVDDHFFTHYTAQDFQALRAQYDQPILCSIQPFQVKQIPTAGCDQLDVQCYTPESFQQCMGLADNLKAILSLSSTSTIRYQNQIQGRTYNVFLWPHSNDYLQPSAEVAVMPNVSSKP